MRSKIGSSTESPAVWSRARPMAELASSTAPYASTRALAFDTGWPVASRVLPPSPALVTILSSLTMAAAPQHRRDQDEDDDELRHNARTHGLVRPGSRETAAEQQCVDPETKRQENDKQADRDEIVKDVHGAKLAPGGALRHASRQPHYEHAWGAGRSRAARLPL